MKKYLAVLVIIMLTHCSALATTSVQYNRAGSMVSVSRGAGMPRSVHNFGSNSPAISRGGTFRTGHYATGYFKRPCQCRRTGPRRMAMTRQMRMQYYLNNQNIANKPAENVSKPIIVTPPKVYTRNGITYYN